MKLTFKKVKEYIVIQLNGSLDTSVSKEVEEDFEEILYQYPELNILLNMKDLKYLSSSGLRTIINIRSVLVEKNKQLKICHMGKNIKDVFEMTKVLSFFKVYHDEESAIQSIHQLEIDEI